MPTQREFTGLFPAGFEFDGNDMTLFESLYPSLQGLLPNFPKEVLAQWAFRHAAQFTQDYWWLGFASICFRMERWSAERIYEEVGAPLLEDGYEVDVLSPHTRDFSHELGDTYY